MKERNRSGLGYRRFVIVPLACLFAAYALAAGLVVWVDNTAENESERSFNEQVAGAADAISVDVAGIFESQREYAERFLSAKEVTAGDLSRAATVLTAVSVELSDGQGRRIAGLGPVHSGQQDLSRSLLAAGEPTASTVGRTASNAVALRLSVPFDASEGRRLLTTVIDIERSRAGVHVARTLAAAGLRTTYLVDSASADVLEAQPTGLTSSRRRLVDTGGGVPAVPPGLRVTSVPVAGTSWRLVAVAPAEDGPLDEAVTDLRPVVGLSALAGVLLVTVIGLAGRNRAGKRETARVDRQRAEIAARARELETLNASLRSANERVADLVGMLTHDVRQPIAAITGYCELMVSDWETSTDAERRKDVERVAGAAVTMSSLVEEILTLTQLDGDTLTANRTPLNAYDSVIEAVAQLCAGQRDGVQIDVDPQRPSVVADPRHVQQMLGNLLSNGMKYGRPPVTVRITEQDGMVDFVVSDSGEGVPADFVAHLFDRYARATTGVAPTKKGTGLGLFIVRELARTNGGTVSYRRQSSGACFVLSLPAAPAPLDLAATAEAPVASGVR